MESRFWLGEAGDWVIDGAPLVAVSVNSMMEGRLDTGPYLPDRTVSVVLRGETPPALRDACDYATLRFEVPVALGETHVYEVRGPWVPIEIVAQLDSFVQQSVRLSLRQHTNADVFTITQVGD